MTKTKRKPQTPVRSTRLVRRWYRADTILPESNKWGDTEYVLCVEACAAEPFVGWYNTKTKSWTVAHFTAPNTPRMVNWWMPLPPAPNDGAEPRGMKTLNNLEP